MANYFGRLAQLVNTVFIFLLLVSCSSTPTPVTTTHVVPSDRVYFKGGSTADASATVVFVKDDGIWASIGYHQLFLDGKLAASLKSGERLQLQLSPGEYVFGILPVAFTSTKEEFLGGYSVTSIDQSLQAGRTYYYRILVDGDNTSRIQRYVPQETELAAR